MRRLLKAVALLCVTVIVAPVAAGGTVLATLIFLPLPAPAPKPPRPVDARISRVFDIDGNLIAEFRQLDLVRPKRLEDYPQVLKDAVVAAEDKRFYEHGGFDLRGTLRALWTDLRNQEVREGGSTITQQYVKSAYLSNERTLTRKIREAILASQLDRQRDKDEILHLYLEQVFFGEGAYGVGAAAEIYFGKTDLHQLTLSEAALLASIIPAPSAYQPRGNPELAEERRKRVLDLMLDQGLIDQAAHDEAVAQELWPVRPDNPPPPDRPVTAVLPRPESRLPYPYFMHYVQRHLDQKYGEGFVFSRSLDIYTTLDPRLQVAAEEEVAATLDGTDPPISMALVAVEPGSGFVKAVVGGRDFYDAANGGQVNIAIGPLGGGTGRQPGSTYKPFVLAEALEQGMAPDTVYSGRNGICFPSGVRPYCVANYGGASYGRLDLREATKRSVNTVYSQLIRDVGVKETMDRARALGVSGSVHTPDSGLAVALGTVSTSPLEMASAYAVWANRGVRQEPTPVVRVVDRREGTVIEDNLHRPGARVMSERSSDLMNSILQAGFTPGGTASGKGLDRPAAGKTGTTENNGDAWFTGYTPQLATSVWLGRTNSREPLRSIKGVASVTGGTLPASTWQRFMERAHEGLPVAEFEQPAPVAEVVDHAQVEARQGFDVANRRQPEGTSDRGPSPVLPPPVVASPPTTATTVPAGATTTTTPARPS